MGDRVFQPCLMTPEGFSMGRVGESLVFAAPIATAGGLFFVARCLAGYVSGEGGGGATFPLKAS